jgi:hypothetical protein
MPQAVSEPTVTRLKRTVPSIGPFQLSAWGPTKSPQACIVPSARSPSVIEDHAATSTKPSSDEGGYEPQQAMVLDAPSPQ